MMMVMIMSNRLIKVTVNCPEASKWSSSLKRWIEINFKGDQSDLKLQTNSPNSVWLLQSSALMAKSIRSLNENELNNKKRLQRWVTWQSWTTRPASWWPSQSPTLIKELTVRDNFNIPSIKCSSFYPWAFDDSTFNKSVVNCRIVSHA